MRLGEALGLIVIVLGVLGFIGCAVGDWTIGPVEKTTSILLAWVHTMSFLFSLFMILTGACIMWFSKQLSKKRFEEKTA